MAPATTPAWSGAVRALVAVLSGLALALCFEPYELPVLLPVGVAGFTLAVHGVRVRRALWLGLLTGVGVHVRAPVLDAVGRLGRLADALHASRPPSSCRSGGACAAVSRRRGWPVWTAALWVAVEVWRSGWPFGGMPWGRLAFATADTPVRPGPALRRRRSA